MLLMRRKGQTAPFTLITLILLFGRKKTEQEENKNTAEPLNREPFPVPDILKKTITTPLVTNPPKERQTKEKPKNKAEERLETIREEVLKAMERLEQIETEG